MHETIRTAQANSVITIASKEASNTIDLLIGGISSNILLQEAWEGRGRQRSFVTKYLKCPKNDCSSPPRCINGSGRIFEQNAQCNPAMDLHPILGSSSLYFFISSFFWKSACELKQTSLGSWKFFAILLWRSCLTLQKSGYIKRRPRSACASAECDFT